MTLIVICHANTGEGASEMFLYPVRTVEYVDMQSDATRCYFQLISINIDMKSNQSDCI